MIDSITEITDNEASKLYARNVVLLHGTIILFWSFFPIVSVFFISLFLIYVKLSKRVFFFYVFMIALIPGLINYTKIPSSDLEIYYYNYDLLYKAPMSDFFKVNPLDPVFYFCSLILAKLSAGFKPLFVLFWSTLTYYVLFIAQFEFSQIFKQKGKLQFVAIMVYTLFIGIDFGLTGHLVRQCVAVSFVMLALTRMCRKKSYWLLLLLAFLIHFSTLIFLVFIPFLKVSRRYALALISILAVVCYTVGQSNLLDVITGAVPGSNSVAVSALLDRASMYIDKDDGAITTRMLVEVLLYFALALFFYFKYSSQKGPNNTTENPKNFFLMFILVGLFLLLIRNNNLLLLRYFFYCYFFSTFVVFMLFKTRRYAGVFFIALYTLTAPIRFFKLLNASEFIFISNDYSLLKKNVFNFLANGEQ